MGLSFILKNYNFDTAWPFEFLPPNIQTPIESFVFLVELSSMLKDLLTFTQA